MAKFTKPKRKKGLRLPPPPPVEKAPNNLEQPEHAPAPPAESKRPERVTGRTAQFATRVRADWLHNFKVYAANNDMKLVELLEKAFEAYKKVNRD